MKTIPKRTISGTVDEEPYHIHEKWTTCEILKMNPEGEPSPKWSASDKVWRLICFPKGYNCDDHFSLFLSCVKLQENHQVSFTIQTIGGKKTKKESSTYPFSPTIKNRGFYKFIPLDDIDSYTVNGKINFEIDIKFNPPKSGNTNLRKEVGHVGLRNQGATCYLNSALECLFHICAFRKIVFSLPTKGDEDITKSVPLALQRLFILMQKSTYSPSTSQLTTAFGWSKKDLFQQNDVQEFMTVFINNLKDKMKETENQDAISRLFDGKFIHFINGLEIEYTSENKEDFNIISLDIQGKSSLKESLNSLVQADMLIDDKKYKLEGYGYIDAFKGTQFLELPPVLHFHLKRYVFNMYIGATKINSRYEFPFELDMSQYMSTKIKNDERYKYELFSVLVHAGGAQFGHYYAYIRPTVDRKWFKFNDEIVSVVSEEAAINDNFGGNKLNSAYYLVYIQKSEIDKIMSPVEDKDIPKHILDYYKEWKSMHSGFSPSISLNVLNEEVYKRSLKINGRIISNLVTPKVKTLGNIKLLDLIPEFKRKAEIISNSEVSLWTVDEFGYPKKHISPASNVSQYFKSSSQIFVTRNNQEFFKDDSRPFLVSYYDSNAIYPLIYIKFVVLKSTSNLVSLMDEIRQLTKINDPTAKFLTYYVHPDGKTEEINPEFTLSKINAHNGMFVFQQHDLAKPDETEEIKTYKSIELLPEYKATTFLKFSDFINKASLFNFIMIDHEEIAFKLLIDKQDSLINLLQCIRKVSNLTNQDSVLLFKKEEKTNSPSERPIIIRKDETIQQVITNNVIYYKIIFNISQEEVGQMKSFRLQILNEDRDTLQTPTLLMPNVFSVNDLVYKIKNINNTLKNKPIRVLQIQDSQIINILKDEEEINDLKDYSLRAEVIPEDQLNLTNNQIVRVTLTIDLDNPRQGSIGKPFIIKIIDNEKFKETRERLCKILKMVNVSFGYTNDYISQDKVKILKDEDCLSELLKGDQTMLFAFLPVEHRKSQKINTFEINNDVVIYN